MTKEEAQKYANQNQNKKNQAQKQVNQLQSNISSMNSSINRLNEENRQMNNQISIRIRETSELSALKGLFDGLKAVFNTKQTNRRNNFNINAKTDFHVKFIDKYRKQMDTELNGSRYKNADNGLSTASKKIADKIQQLQREVSKLQDDVDKNTRKVNSLQEDVRSSQSKLNNAQEDVRYYGNQVSYWNNRARNL